MMNILNKNSNFAYYIQHCAPYWIRTSKNSGFKPVTFAVWISQWRKYVPKVGVEPTKARFLRPLAVPFALATWASIVPVERFELSKDQGLSLLALPICIIHTGVK